MSALDPSIPTAPHDHPPAPIRDNRPTEDLDREPDGIPHVLIGLGALVLLVIASSALMVVSGHVSTNRGAAMMVMIGGAVLGVLLFMIAKRWRKQGQSHASR